MGRNIVSNLIEFKYEGIIYEVGPRGGVVFGRRIYRSVSDIPDQIDLAVLLAPSRTVPDILEECGQKGIRNVVVEAAGFREYGEKGRAVEDKAVETARKWGIRMVGPNCIGIINMENGLCLPFTNLKRIVESGGISIISQSGGVGLSFMNLLASESLGLNKFISIGNKLDVDEIESLEYLLEDEGTQIICMYLEGFTDGRRLMEVARRSRKPILLHKSNVGRLSRQIAQSHTASLADDDRVTDAALTQAGIARVRDTQTLGNFLKILMLPRMQGNRLAILSRSGGHAVIAADSCELYDFELPAFPESFLKEIEKHFRAKVIKLTNPLDLGDLFDFHVYQKIVEETLKYEDIDGIVFLHIYFSSTEGEESRLLFETLEKLSHQYQKPVAICVSTDEQEISQLKKTLSFPVFINPEDTIQALELSRDYECCELRPPSERPRIDARKEQIAEIIESSFDFNGHIPLHRSLDLIERYGIPVGNGRLVATPDELAAHVKEVGALVALKVVSQDISHKSDVGGVVLNVDGVAQAQEAYERMMSLATREIERDRIQGVFVQPMVEGGQEMILGGRRDPQFGPVVIVGFGGIFVEVLKDISLRVAPIDTDQGYRMLKELKGAPILYGVRGEGPRDVEALADCLVRLSWLMTDFPEITEIDINPIKLFARGKGAMALDCRIIVGTGGVPGRVSQKPVGEQSTV
jgi:acetyltransferase